MIRAMLDTDTPLALTGSTIRTDLLGTYADLVTAEMLAELVAEWPRVVLIDRGMGDPLGKASVIDVESGAHRPADAPGWYDRQKARGVKYLTVYAARSSLPAINAAMGSRSFYRWVATLDGTMHVAPFTAGHAPAAVQCLGATQLGFHADLSLILEDHWQPTPPTDADKAWIAGGLAALTRAEGTLTSLRELLQAHKT